MIRKVFWRWTLPMTAAALTWRLMLWGAYPRPAAWFAWRLLAALALSAAIGLLAGAAWWWLSTNRPSQRS